MLNSYITVFSDVHHLSHRHLQPCQCLMKRGFFFFFRVQLVTTLKNVLKRVIHIVEVKRSEGGESRCFHGSVKSDQPYKNDISKPEAWGVPHHNVKTTHYYL